MKTQPITPAQIEFGPAVSDPPRAPAFDDIYHPHVGALAQARHVFLQGNGLPGRWAGRADFVILETGFGLGNNFLATWQAWRLDPARCERLHFVSIERHPPSAADLARAHADSPLADLALQLLGAWPPLTPNLHGLDFEGGRIRLTLALGDVAMLLPALRLSADAVFLDGFAPARNPQMWQPRVLKAIGRLAAPQATAASWSVAREVRAGLSTAGFEVQRAHGIGGKREITLAQHRPRVSTRAPRGPRAGRPQCRGGGRRPGGRSCSASPGPPGPAGDRAGARYRAGAAGVGQPGRAVPRHGEWRRRHTRPPVPGCGPGRPHRIPVGDKLRRRAWQHARPVAPGWLGRGSAGPASPAAAPEPAGGLRPGARFPGRIPAGRYLSCRARPGGTRGAAGSHRQTGCATH